MQYIIKNRRPASVFRFFEEISAIPRGSFQEEKIADHLVAFAKERGLYCYRDAMNNVLIKAPASPGYEEHPPLVLQGHTDMVCEKNSDTVHDFTKDPLKLYVDGKFLKAEGTTLGGDDGIAVAMMLALLDGEVAEHPAYECLFTTAEEVGLNGAQAFDYSLLDGRRMLNLDSEEQGVVTAGCAGGLRTELRMDFSPIAFAGECLHLRLKGLAGGHSGENINSGRANANKLMGRILARLANDNGDACRELHIVSLDGGSKDNAIPRECEAVISVSSAEEAMAVIEEEAALIAGELGESDRGFELVCYTDEEQACMMNELDTRRAIAVLACSANGVLEMSRSIEGLVEYSRNLGVVSSEEGKLTFVFSTRSSFEARLDASVRELDLLATVTDCKARHYSRYPGWSYCKTSALREAYCRAYREVLEQEARVNVIHAGLECGVIRSFVPDMDMISIGPNMQDIHSPDEALDLDSVEEFWSVLAHLIPQL